MLLNLDTENEGVIIAGCSGGFVDNVTIPVSRTEGKGSIVTIQVKGLRGGHSGLEIGEQRGNANKMAGRLLNHLNQTADISLISIDGGSADNVITPACTVKVLTPDADAVIAGTKELEENWISEFAGEEPGLQVLVEAEEGTAQVMDKASTLKVIHFVCNSPYGVQGLSRALKGQVESSLNCGIVKTEDDCIRAMLYVRSSVNSKWTSFTKLYAVLPPYLEEPAKRPMNIRHGCTRKIPGFARFFWIHTNSSLAKSRR